MLHFVQSHRIGTFNVIAAVAKMAAVAHAVFFVGPRNFLVTLFLEIACKRFGKVAL